MLVFTMYACHRRGPAAVRSDNLGSREEALGQPFQMDTLTPNATDIHKVVSVCCETTPSHYGMEPKQLSGPRAEGERFVHSGCSIPTLANRIL